jgi:hypothetical protein
MKYLFSVIVLVFLLNACKKETIIEQGAPAPEDIEMNRITANPWIVYKVTLGGTDIWNLGLIPSCQKDDTYKFRRDSSLTQYENSEVCSGGTDSTESTWTFYEGRKKIIGSVLGIDDTATILDLQETTMNLLVDYNGNPVTVYFKKN